jgi:predicted phage tail protein
MFHRVRLLSAIILFLVAISVLPLHQYTRAAELQVATFDSFHVDINILSNSDMEITETQKYSFLEGTFHYGYRWIPLDEVGSIDTIQVYEDGRPYVRNPAVRRWIDNYQQTGESPAGDYYAYYTWTEDDKLWIGWWYPETKGGSRVFEISYVVHGGLWLHSEGDQLYWRAVFGDRDTAISRATVTVRFPEPISDQLTIYSYGAETQNQVIDDRTIEFTTTGPVPNDMALDIRVIFPHGIVATPTAFPEKPRGVGGWIAQTVGEARLWIEDNPTTMVVINWCLFGTGAALILGGAFWLITIQRKRAAQSKMYSPSSYLTAPPDNLAPALVGKLINGTYGFLGDIFYLAQQGFLTITEEVEQKWYGRKRDFMLERCNIKKHPPYRYQVYLMDFLFHGEPQIRLSENRHAWHRTAERAQEQLDADGIRLGLLKRVDRETIRTTGWGARHLGKAGLACSTLGIIILGISVTIQAGGAALFTGGVALILGVASLHLTMVSARVKKTEKGTLAATQWQSYIYYLWLAAKGRFILTRKTDQLNTDLPYAVRFGLGQKLVRALTMMGRPSPAPYWYHPHLMPEDIRYPDRELSLLDIRGGFSKLLSVIGRALPAMAEVGPARMLTSVPVVPDETIEG